MRALDDMAQAVPIFRIPNSTGNASQQNSVAVRLVDDVSLNTIAARISRLQSQFSNGMKFHRWTSLSPRGRV